jgi:glycine cleavage system H protein
MTDIQPHDVPHDRCYDSVHHLWARLDQDTGHVIVGIDSLGLESLGELAYIGLHDQGSRVTRGDAVGTLEAAKMTSLIVTPVSGTIVRRNEDVLRDPLRVNRDPYDTGWLVAIEPTDWEGDRRRLISGQAIDSWVAGEIERLRTEGASG